MNHISSMKEPVFLSGLTTALPPHKLPQDLVERNARRILGPRFDNFERMAKSFHTGGVETRYSFAPIEWFDTPKGWPERNGLYLNEGKKLFIKAATAALVASNIDPLAVDTIVTISSTGIATPTVEALAMEEMGFRQDVQRVPVFGLGCAGGVSGLSVAAQLARGAPGSKVLLVALEACTLSFRSDRLRKADIIATVLFGDGAAAAIVSTDDGVQSKCHLGAGIQKTWPDTLDIMGWSVDGDGLGVIFDRSIPAFASEHMREAFDAACEAAGLPKNDLARPVFHPGGTKVVEALENALELQAGTCAAERRILRDYGNMSAPTALFVLKEVMEQGQRGKMMMGALGPGFTASFLPVTVM